MSTKTVPTVYQQCINHQKRSKTVKTAKMTIGVLIVTGLPRLYQQCTNRQKHSNSKNDHFPHRVRQIHKVRVRVRVCRPRPPNTQSHLKTKVISLFYGTFYESIKRSLSWHQFWPQTPPPNCLVGKSEKKNKIFAQKVLLTWVSFRLSLNVVRFTFSS